MSIEFLKFVNTLFQCIYAGITLVLFSPIFAQQLFAVPSTTLANVFVPGNDLQAEFTNSLGETSKLPKEGRYLLWVVSSFFALETREVVSQAEMDPNLESELINPVIVLAEFLDLQPAYVLFYDPDFMPERVQYSLIAERLKPNTVLFDEQGNIPIKVNLSGFLLTTPSQEGLYLMEGQTVKYRYPWAYIWLYHQNQSDPQIPYQLFVEEIKRFLNGAEPQVQPLVNSIGSAIPKSLLSLLPLHGLFVLTFVPNPSTSEQLPEEFRSQAGKYLEIVPLLKDCGVQPIGIVLGDQEGIEQLKTQLPDWQLIPAPTQWHLMLSELNNDSMLFVDKDGIIQASLIIFMDQTANASLVKQALELLK